MDYVSNSVLVCCILLDVFFMICPKMLERKIEFAGVSIFVTVHEFTCDQCEKLCTAY